MSSNQKQAPALAPPQQRYSNAQGPTYLQRPPTPHRTEGFHTSTPPTYVQQAPQLNQPPNQGQPGLRGMAPTGPPTQASTPPQSAEMKVQQIPQQQQAMQPLVWTAKDGINYKTFVQQSVRGAPNFYTRQPPPQNQNAPRMTNPHRGQMQQMYPPQSVQMYPNMSQVYISNQFPVTYNGAPRQNYIQPFQLMAGQPICPTYPTQQPATQTAYFYQPQQMPMQTRIGPPQPVNPAPPNPAQAPPQSTIPLNPPQQPQQPVVKKRRAFALTIVDPNTGKDKSKEIYEGEGESSPPQSGESSARQTPQPTSVVNVNVNSKEVQAAFAAQVAQAIGSDEGAGVSGMMEHHDVAPNLVGAHPNQMMPPLMREIDPYHAASQQQQQQPPPPQLQPPIKELVQSSKLQIPVREFVPQSASSGVASTAHKETPVVSAITDAVEVTITNKIPKDRESPVKGRKSRESVAQQQQQQQQQPPPQPPREQQQHGRAEHMTGSAKEFVPRETQQREQPLPPKEHQVPKEEVQTQKEVLAAKEIATSGQPPVQGRDSVEPKGGKGYKGKQQHVAATTADMKSVGADQQKMTVSGGAAIVNNPPPPSAAIMTATPSSVVLEKTPESVPPSATPAATVPESTSVASQSGRSKSSNTSQKTKDSSNKQSSGQQGQQVTTAPVAASAAAKPAAATSAVPVVAVPVSQPAKSSNKTSKMRDLNIKGANKEGTDMDAFATADSVTNVPVASVVDENFTSSVAASTVAESKPAPPSVDEVVPEETIPPVIAAPVETKTLPKHTVDVCSIVKEVPKPLNFPPAQPPAKSQDEADRALTANEKLVQAKNEANSKANAVDNNGESGVIERQKLPYREDQWSPFNKEGKKVYDRDFLVLLQNDPKSKKKPDNLPNLDVVLKDSSNRRDGADKRYSSLSSSQNDFSPMYAVRSQSQRGPLQKRNSQQGKIANKGGKPNVIHVSLSLREDIKLHETENAWRPARLVPGGQSMNDDEKKTAELYKKVRGVLNKLTPQKFDTLVDQVRALQIDNTDRLQGVIDIVFEKAVDEPSFSVAYALMCRELALMQVPAERKKDGAGPEFVNFRKLLVTRCQLEFEKNSIDEETRKTKEAEIEACADPEKKKELQLLLDEEERRLRMKAVGNIRFIGELFKQQMLTANIMVRCLTNLLQEKDEESLECLCKLLSTIGKDMEINKKMKLDPFFQTMQEIVDKKHGKVSSRVRFMLQDVIDLRNSKWVPRRQDLNPKTMDQIQKEASEEQLNIQVMNSIPMNTPRKDDRGGSGPNSDRKRRNVSDDGWSSVTPRNRAQYSVESSKLKNKPPPMDEIQLGSSTLFGNWGRGSNIKNPAIPPTNTNNMYAALAENSDIDKRPMGGGSRSSNKEPYSSKGPSMERYKSYEDGRGSRNNSQHRSRDSSVNSQRSGHMGSSGQQQSQPQQRDQQPPPQQQQQPQSLPPSLPAKTAAPVSAAPPTELSPDVLERRINNILDEYLNDSCKVTECDLDVKTMLPASCHDQLVTQWFNNVLERSGTARQKTGDLAAQLVKSGTISLDNYTKGLDEVLSIAEDLTIDIPKIWDYLAELIVPVLSEDVLPMERLKQSFDCLIPTGYAPKLLDLLIKLLIKMKGPNFVQENWQKSGLQLSVFFKSQASADDVNNFVKENQLEFLVIGGNAPAGNSQLSNEQIREKLLQFFKADTSYDDITNWINANLGDKVQDVGFIRSLMTAICEDSIVASKLKPELLKKHYSLLRRYVDSNETLELHCLYALQALIHKLEHPSGILLLIFDRLWDDSVFSYDSFIAWESSKDSAELEGKGVALKQLTSFFTALKENEDESSTSTSEEA